MPAFTQLVRLLNGIGDADDEFMGVDSRSVHGYIESSGDELMDAAQPGPSRGRKCRSPVHGYMECSGDELVDAQPGPSRTHADMEYDDFLSESGLGVGAASDQEECRNTGHTARGGKSQKTALFDDALLVRYRATSHTNTILTIATRMPTTETWLTVLP
jgi:hypothetical protein